MLIMLHKNNYITPENVSFSYIAKSYSVLKCTIIKLRLNPVFVRVTWWTKCKYLFTLFFVFDHEVKSPKNSLIL